MTTLERDTGKRGTGERGAEERGAEERGSGHGSDDSRGGGAFGALLRRLREAAGLSQAALAERAGLSVEAVSALERGTRRQPHAATVRLLAEALGITPAQRAALDAAGRPHRGSVGASTRPWLPVSLTPLLGREHDEAAITHMLQQERVRLLTLSGPAGVGKTRLALQVAANLDDTFADGVVFVPLASLSEPRLVAATIAHVVGVTETGRQTVLESLAVALREKHLLVVLDNFEHLLAAAPQVAGLLAACPRLKALVTSRAVLRVQGEHEYPVPPLALPDPTQAATVEALAQCPAVELLTQRARAVKPNFALSPSNAAAVAEICRRLDGLPLAIELAAARLKLFSPPTLLARLEHRLPELAGGARDLPARLQTMRRALAWSYDLLTPDEQTLFRRLAVFVGGCTLEAAEAVCIGPSTLGVEVLAGIASLVDHSLLRVDEPDGGEPRLEMLETIREYGLECLAATSEAEVLRQQHATYFVRRVEGAELELRGPRQVLWANRLTTDHDNLRAALRWALQSGEVETGLRLGAVLWWFWWVRGHLSEGRRWLEELVEQAGDPDRCVKTGTTALRAKALQGASVLAYRHGDYAQAIVLADDSLAVRRALGDTWGIAASLTCLGLAAQGQGDYARAAPLFEESLALYRGLGDQWTLANVLDNLGAVTREQGDYARADALHEESLALFRALQDTWGSSFVLINLATVARYRDDHGRAAALYVECLALQRDLGDRGGMARSIEGLAAVAAAQGHWEQTTQLYGAAATLRDGVSVPLALADRVGYSRTVATTRTVLGDDAFAAAWARGQAMSLEQCFQAAYEMSPA